MAKAKCDKCLKDNYRRQYGPYEGLSEADFLCNDCEEYLCSNCINEHSRHLTFALKDKRNKTEFDKFCDKMMFQMTSKGPVYTLDRFKQERRHICDVVDVVGGEMRPSSSGGTNVEYICILRESKKWAITDCYNKCIKVFNINNNQMARKIHLLYKPQSIAEIPSTDPSQSLIAVSFRNKKQIDIMNVYSEPAHVMSSINVHRPCYDLAYCNNKLITRCEGYLDDSIQVMNMSGEIINFIYLSKLPDFKLGHFNTICMCVHSESETIYVCRFSGPPCVISLSLDGQVLHYVKFTDLCPRIICVDRDQNVYVTGYISLLYKLSSDFSQTEKCIDERWILCFPDSHKFKAIACHADTFYIVRSDGRVCIIRNE